MSVAKCVDYFPSEEAAEICGFHSADAILKVEYAANGTDQTFTLSVGARMPDQSGRYVRLEEDGAIYALSTDSIDADRGQVVEQVLHQGGGGDVVASLKPEGGLVLPARPPPTGTATTCA